MVGMYVRTIVLLASALSTLGCTSVFPLGQSPQSHFTSPHAKVTPLGNVYGEATVTTFGPAAITGQMEEEAIDDALSKVPNANVLLDYYASYEQKGFGLFNTSTYSVQGVAAQAEEE
jgi:hypothetical protein